jgi:hypothetical protein
MLFVVHQGVPSVSTWVQIKWSWLDCFNFSL